MGPVARALAGLGLAAWASGAAAEPVWNLGALAAPMHRGPSPGEPVIDWLAPGALAELGRCDAARRWCLVSNDSQAGWIDTDAVPLQRRGGGPAARPVAPSSTIVVTPLPTGPRPLPGAILDAVPPPAPAPAAPAAPAVPAVVPVLLDVPGARTPRLLSGTEPVRNVTDGRVNLRAGPGTQHAVVGGLDPGQGGRIEFCDAWERWCLIAAPGGLGWVKMTLVGERRIAMGLR